MKNIDLRYNARIHSIETCGTLDGPGVRFVLFMQGCHLKCKYCQNRDTWDVNSGKIKTLDEIFNEIMRYKNYICPDGGVTVSGGEPLLQPKFLIELFKKLKTENIHTCIDTSGMYIKHIDTNKCKDLVGSYNDKELEFAKYLSNNGIHMWIRQVLVPGYTDDEQDLLKLKEFISTLKNVDRFEFLPYHDMGKYKWDKLGVKYELEGVRTANDEDVNRAKKILGIS